MALSACLEMAATGEVNEWPRCLGVSNSGNLVLFLLAPSPPFDFCPLHPLSRQTFIFYLSSIFHRSEFHSAIHSFILSLFVLGLRPVLDLQGKEALPCCRFSAAGTGTYSFASLYPRFFSGLSYLCASSLSPLSECLPIESIVCSTLYTNLASFEHAAFACHREQASSFQVCCPELPLPVLSHVFSTPPPIIAHHTIAHGISLLTGEALDGVRPDSSAAAHVADAAVPPPLLFSKPMPCCRLQQKAALFLETRPRLSSVTSGYPNSGKRVIANSEAAERQP